MILLALTLEMNSTAAILYILPLLITYGAYIKLRRARSKEDEARYKEAVESGLLEPPSLHPVFDLQKCIGSGACIKACPEEALGFVDGVPQLINAASCIGHGACYAACPVDSIKLVFGTQRRGVELPFVDPHFETNVPGLFIAGELGGMGLIHKATEQGRQAMDEIAKRKKVGDSLDVVIVGSGPAGISASLRAKELKLKFVTIEQEESLGGAVFQYPRNKMAMTSPMRLPQHGPIKFGEISKESLLAFWQEVIRKTSLEIKFRERMESISRGEQGFIVKTSSSNFRARCVLLTIGRRGTPRKLGVPGEELPKVVYRLIDAEQYRGKRVIVVGGGDSAIEAALALSDQARTTVTLSYRGEAFNRIKPKNRERLDAAKASGRVNVLMSSEIGFVTADKVMFKIGDQKTQIPNDAVIVCTGGELPTKMLRDLGVEVEVHHGEEVAA
jgi:thioredoxin reductase (NADPH)